jgi:hypothetical protein
MPATIQTTLRLALPFPLGFLRFHSESIGTVWNVDDKRSEQPGDTPRALLTGNQRAVEYYRKVGLVKAIDLGFDRHGRNSGISERVPRAGNEPLATASLKSTVV